MNEPSFLIYCNTTTSFSTKASVRLPIFSSHEFLIERTLHVIKIQCIQGDQLRQEHIQRLILMVSHMIAKNKAPFLNCMSM